MPDDFPGLSRIGQIAVNVGDVDRATAFYRDVVGLPFLFAVPTMAFFRAGEIRLMLAVAETPELDHPASVLYFDVPDIEAAHQALTGRGVDFVSVPHRVHRDGKNELWLAFFQDSERNLLALMCTRPAA